MRLADLASILAQGCTLWTDSFKLSGTPARSGGFRFYKKTDGRTIGRPLFSLREIKKYAILLLCRQVRPTRRLPPQRRTEAEVVKMTNVELFNSLLTVIGIIVSAVSLGITLSHR